MNDWTRSIHVFPLWSLRCWEGQSWLFITVDNNSVTEEKQKQNKRRKELYAWFISRSVRQKKGSFSFPLPSACHHFIHVSDSVWHLQHITQCDSIDVWVHSSGFSISQRLQFSACSLMNPVSWFSTPCIDFCIYVHVRVCYWIKRTKFWQCQKSEYWHALITDNNKSTENFSLLL